MTGKQNSAASWPVGGAAHMVGDWFRLPRGGIGTRVAACFALIVLSMIVADVVAGWQFIRTVAPGQQLAEADRISLAVMRVHFDVDAFRDRMAALASTHDTRQFTTDATALRKRFLEDLAHCQQLVESSVHAQQNAGIRSALEALRATLPSQLDTVVELASAGDWPAVNLRIANQMQALIDLSSSLVNDVEQALSEQRAEAIRKGHVARRELMIILPAAALVTLVVAVALGWHATRSITAPLSALQAGARALAKGDFQHRVAIQHDDELAELGRVLNDSAQQLATLYETLRRNETRLRLTIDTIPAYVWSALPDGSVDFVNRRWLEFSGVSAEQVLGWGWADSVHADDRPQFIEALADALRSGKPMEAEARVRRADGQYRWLLIRNVPMRDEAGKVVKWYGTGSDIDDRKRAEQALTRSEAYLADAQRLTHTGAWASDSSTRPLYWSDEVFRIFGFDADQGLPPPDRPLQRVHPEDRGKFWEAFQRTIREHVDSEIEYRVVLPDGKARHVHALAHPVLNQDKELVEVVGTIVDITGKKQAEEEHERLRELEVELAHINRVSILGELAASVAHEVNQPLSGIVSNGSACLRWLTGNPPNLDEVREAVRDIVRDGKRAGEIIARIRALTRRAPTSREDLDLNELIREVLALVCDEAKRNRTIVRTQLASDVSPLFGDRVQLQQLMLNLVINAIEAMSAVEEDRVREMTITTRNIGAAQVLITVADSGVGLDPAAANRIFEPFYTTKPTGMGMGLSICRSIVQNHGGRLWADPNDGPGTTFHVSLPVHREERIHAGATGS